MANKITESFTAIPDWYWECGLDIYEVNIISRIASWQRQNKEYFESYDHVACVFRTHYQTIRNKFIRLESEGIIKCVGKVGRTKKWTINSNKLNAMKHSYTKCKKDDTFLHEVEDVLTRDVSYKTPKTSNKTSFRAEESLGDSSPRDMELEVQRMDFSDFDK